MSFDWTQFLELAKALQEDPNSPGPEEAALRTATSRAYYAAFHVALDFVSLEGYIPKHHGEDHHGVRKHFLDKRSSDKARRKVHNELDRLYDDRRQADYEASFRGYSRGSARAMAYAAVRMAESILHNLEGLASAKSDRTT